MGGRGKAGEDTEQDREAAPLQAVCLRPPREGLLLGSGWPGLGARAGWGRGPLSKSCCPWGGEEASRSQAPWGAGDSRVPGAGAHNGLGESDNLGWGSHRPEPLGKHS